VKRATNRIRVALALGILVGSGAAGHARAEDLEAAGHHYAAGKAAFDKGDWARAVAEFEAAFQLARDPALQLNLAEAHDRAGDGAAAVKSCHAYLELAPAAPDRAAVERRIAALEEKYHLPPSTVPPPVPIVPPHAPVVVQPQPEAPVETPPVPINPPHAPVVVQPKPEAPPAEGENGGLLDESRLSRTRRIAWAGVAATVALVTAGGIMGLAAQSRSDEISRREQMVGLDGQPPRFDAATESQFSGLRSDGQAFDRAAIALLTAAGVTAVASGVLFYVDHRNKGGEKPVTLAPSLGPRGAGLSARWEF
jgi:hypothetical protein